MIYMASPYTNHSKEVRELFFEILCDITAQMFNRGEYVFTPIVYAHPVAARHNLPPDWDYWKEYDEKFISICTHLWVLKFPGWEESKGVQAEIKIAGGLGLPVQYVELSEFGITTQDLWNIVNTPPDEADKLSKAVDSFTNAMKVKLHQKATMGFYGWDDAKYKDHIGNQLVARATQLSQGSTHQAVDVANLAMFLHHQKD